MVSWMTHNNHIDILVHAQSESGKQTLIYSVTLHEGERYISFVDDCKNLKIISLRKGNLKVVGTIYFSSVILILHISSDGYTSRYVDDCLLIPSYAVHL